MICETSGLSINEGNTNCLQPKNDLSSLCIEQNLNKGIIQTEINKNSLINTCTDKKNNKRVKFTQQYVINKSDISEESEKESKTIDAHQRLVEEAHKAIKNVSQNQNRSKSGILCGAALKLPNGKIMTGINSSLFHSATAVIIKACKSFVGLPDDVYLLSTIVIESIGKMKEVVYKKEEPSLDVRELLIALAVESTMNPSVAQALELFPKFNGCEMHLTHIPTLGDQSGLEKLGIIFTYDPAPSSLSTVE